MTKSPSAAAAATTFAAVDRLLAKIVKDEVEALAHLYDLTAPRVLGLVSRVVGPGEPADQVTLSVYEAIWTGAESVPTDGGLPGLLDVAHRLAVAHKRGGEDAWVPRQRTSRQAARSFPPDKGWLTELAEDERQALAEVYLRGRTASEADERLGWVPGTCLATLHRSMLHLAELHNRESQTVMA